uniref:Rab-GAP TBC domain-containing protein n=1 Tax=Arcella intermedia TaxID=1963864 RepID=A0A6B2LC07_9EUKA
MIRKGIPREIRGDAWKVISGAEALKQKSPGVYEMLVCEKSVDEGALVKDMHRTFPTNSLFKLKEGEGQRALFNVLKAFSLMDPEVGYCQGMSFIVGILVQYASEVDAFWILVALLKMYNFRGLYISGLPLLKHSLYRFHFLLQKHLPTLYLHFLELRIRPLLYSSEWFSTLFAYNSDIETTSRLWDVMLLEGPAYLFRVGLAILKRVEGDLVGMGFDEIMIFLKNGVVEEVEGLMVVADGFVGVEEDLVGIDERFEGVKAFR